VTVLSGRYELGRRLGTGGMGEVFEARDLRLDRRVAVKLLLPAVTDPSARARFVREVQLAASLTHPNLVTVFDADASQGARPYFVMELVDGRTLAAEIAAGPLRVDDATHIADGFLTGLGVVHAHGLVHRDVKPANVLLGGDGAVKLADFGIAKAAQDVTTGLTATGAMVGTPKYFAPEQLAGEPVGPATDVYAAGVVLDEMFAGRRAEVPAGITAVIDRARAKEPTARFADASVMREALADAARGDDAAATLPHVTRVLSSPPPAAAASERRRRWLPLALIGAVVAIALVGAAFALGGHDEPGRGRAAAAAPSSTSTSTSSSTSTTTTTIPTPTSLPELAAVLAGNPGAYGTRGPELLAGLQQILAGDDEDGDTASGLYDDVPDWAVDGQLDPEIAALARQLLVPYLEGIGDPGEKPKGPGKGHDKERGPGPAPRP
jgi:serine/threonine-protein kinase